MPIRAITPTSIAIENFGDTTMYIANFDSTAQVNKDCGNPGISGGDSDVWNSSLNAVVGYWFHATDAPTTQTSERVDVTLNSISTGQFKFLSSEKARTGKLYIMTLT